MLVTKTDISIACERRKISAPVTSTEPMPSASGSIAAANEPKTASRISRTIGNPADSAFARSSFDRSCIAAHSAPWPTRWVATPARGPSATASRSRRSAATAVASSSSTSAASGTSTVLPAAAWLSACSRAAGASETPPTGPAAAATRSTAARSCCSDAPSSGISTAASCARWTPGKSASAESTIADCEPGTPKPPLERSSDWRAANGTAASRIAAHAISTMRL